MENTENKETKTKKNKSNKVILKIVKWVLGVLILLVIFIAGMKVSDTFEHRENVLNFGFKDMGFLITQEWYGRVVEDSRDDRKFFNLFSIPFTESRQLFSIDIEVFAGIEFKEIEYVVNHDRGVIYVTLPHAVVHNSSTVPNSMKVYLDNESWFSRIDIEENEEARNSLVEKATKSAVESGILEKAENNAEQLITNMIRNNGECSNNVCGDYEFKFQYK